LQEPGAGRKLGLRRLESRTATHDQEHADDQASQGAAQHRQSGHVGLLLLGPQRGKPARQQQSLSLDEGVGDLPDMIGRGPSGIARQRRVAAVELKGHYGGVEFAQLLRAGRAKLGDLA
jgi:hypothetical protein